MIHRITIIVCPLLVVAMTIAVWHHSLSVRNIPTEITRPTNAPVKESAATRTNPEVAIATPQPPAKPAAASTPSEPQREFYASMLKQIENLQNQNQDLLDQLAETNRELMKLEFRVDTHSSQFRPLQVTDERQDTGFDDSSGLLPPRPMVIGEEFGE